MTDLLTIEPHTPAPEPVKYNKEDGQWYTHDGVDVKDTQQRKGEFNVEKLTIHLVHVFTIQCSPLAPVPCQNCHLPGSPGNEGHSCDK